MTTVQKPDSSAEVRPWYREPWPWVAIAIPAAAVIMGAVTLYLALSNPDYLVVDEQDYRDIRSGMQAQPAQKDPDDRENPPDRDDGDR